MSVRDPHAPAPGWHVAAPGVWSRVPHGCAALVRCHAGRFVMRIGDERGNGGAWLPAGDTLLAATEHAGGHAARVELAAARGGDDLCGTCPQCARLTKENGR